MCFLEFPEIGGGLDHSTFLYELQVYNLQSSQGTSIEPLELHNQLPISCSPFKPSPLPHLNTSPNCQPPHASPPDHPPQPQLSSPRLRSPLPTRPTVPNLPLPPASPSPPLFAWWGKSFLYPARVLCTLIEQPSSDYYRIEGFGMFETFSIFPHSYQSLAFAFVRPCPQWIPKPNCHAEHAAKTCLSPKAAH